MKKFCIAVALTFLVLAGFVSCDNKEVASFYIENATDCTVENILVSWTTPDGVINNVLVPDLGPFKCSKYYAVLMEDSRFISFDDYTQPFTITYEICGETFDVNDSNTAKQDQDGNCRDDEAVFIEYETTLIKISRDSYRIYNND